MPVQASAEDVAWWEPTPPEAPPATIWGKPYQLVKRSLDGQVGDGLTSRFKKCQHCGAPMPVYRAVHTSRTCPPYAKLWAGDQRMKLFANLAAYSDQDWPAHVTPAVRMTTVTAPGTKPRSAAQRRSLAQLGLDGLDSETAIAIWNANASWMWTTLHRAAQAATKRGCGHTATLLAYAWQQQNRGALHIHVVLGNTLPSEVTAARIYIEELDRLAETNGFGFVDRKADVREASAAAAYLSSYLCEGKAGKISVRESVLSKVLPRNAVYVKPELLRMTGISMRTLRLRRFLFHRIGVAWLRNLHHLGLDLEEAYVLVVRGYWGPALHEALFEARAP